MLESPDREIWEFAKGGNFVIVSAHSDFYELATTIGPPPKVVWLRRWTHPTRDAERVLRREAIRIPREVTSQLSESNRRAIGLGGRMWQRLP